MRDVHALASIVKLRASRGVTSIIVMVAVGGGAGCARQPPMATAADAQRGNVELAELHEGRKLLIRKCTNCHRAPIPDEYEAAEWPQKVQEMAERSSIDGAQQQLIEKYLVTLSTR
jgi:hypothetical protein